jgi:hypothetical protein
VTVPFLRYAVCAMLLGAAGGAAAQEGPKFEFHGFVGGSVFSEHGALSSNGGQGAWFAAALPIDKDQFGGDVRQTRLAFSLTGAQIFDGATPRAFAEMDFFGGNTGGSFGDVSIAPRLRVAYAELKLAKTGTMVRVGQDHDLIIGLLVPQTVGHVAFPLSYSNGTIGWRRPGVGVYQTLPLPVADMKVEVAAQVGRSTFDALAPAATAPTTPAFSTSGTASNLPAFEGRVKLQAKIFEVFVAAHYNETDLNGAGIGGANTTLKTQAFTAGGKVSYMGATLQGAGYTGKNLAPLAGNLLQFPNWAAFVANPDGLPSVDEKGAWAQVGYNITPTISAWLLTGFSNPDDEDLAKLGMTRGRNSTTSGMLRYQSKGYAAAAEYSTFSTKYTNRTTGVYANQLMLSGMYFF